MIKQDTGNNGESSRNVESRKNDFCANSTAGIFRKDKKDNNGVLSAKRKRTIFIIAMLAIPVANWLVFWLFVNVQSIALAFQDPRTGALGFTNFLDVWDLVVRPINNELGISLVNTLKYFGLAVLVIMPLCLIVSYFFYKRIAGYKVFRIIFYFPAIISSVVMVTAFSEFVSPSGPLGEIQRMLGITPNPVSPLSRYETATQTILVYCVLVGLTTNVLLFTSGMSRIPVEVLEAAKLDGIGPVRELITILFPLIWPTFSTQIIFAMTGLFNSSGPILLFTGGNYDTSTISFWIFKQMYGSDGMGPSGGAYNLVSATGLCCTLIGVPLVLLARKLVEKIDSVEY